MKLENTEGDSLEGSAHTFMYNPHILPIIATDRICTVHVESIKLLTIIKAQTGKNGRICKCETFSCIICVLNVL